MDEQQQRVKDWMACYGLGTDPQVRMLDLSSEVGELAKEGTRVLLRQLEDGIIDHRRIYLDNKLIVRETVKDMREISR